ncbi:MAG: helix-turn-helix domain-containing protein [Paracoccaceae bacterium]|nr:helix-turn-helix domain-containing protein [Paracoccaceae bacterium]
MSKTFDVEIAVEGVKPTALYTAREAATLLRVSPRTLERWRKDGRGPRVTRLWKHARPLYLGRDILIALDGSAEE